LLRSLSRLRTAVGKFRPVTTAAAPRAVQRDLARWNDRLDALEQASNALRVGFPDELLLLRRRLHEVAGREPLPEAVGMLSPSVAESLARYAARPLPDRATSRDRGLEHRIIRYLQRLVAKNETNSFFGPVGSAGIDPQASAPLRVLGEPGCGPPVVFSSPRVARAIAELLAADPEIGAHVPLRRSPMFRLAGSRLTHLPTGRSLRPGPGELAAWRGAGGSPGCGAPAAAPPGRPELPERLIRLGALTRQVPLDLWSAEPLDSLEDWLRRLPPGPAIARWLARIGELRADIRSFAAARGGDRGAVLSRLEQRVADLTGASRRQGAGGMYTDRSVLFEERENRISLTIGGPAATGLAGQLAPALTYWAAAACQRREQHQRVAAELFDRAWPDRHEVPLPTYLAAAAALPAVTAPTNAELHVDAVIGELAREGTAQVRLPAQELESLGTAIDGPVFSSVDLLVAADERGAATGAVRWVLGEAHAGHLLSVFPTDHFARCRDPRVGERRDRWLWQALQSTGRRVAWLVTGRDTKIFQYRLPAPAVQLRPHLPEHAAHPASELVVRRAAGGVALHDAEGPLWLLPAVRPATEGFDPLAALTLPAVHHVPFGRGARRPRVVVGDTVVQRASWHVPATGLAALPGVEQFLAARSFRREHGMPEQVFVRVPGEPKPALLDFRNPLSVGAFAGQLRHDPAGGTDGTPMFSEMLPGPAELWLADRRTFELRILAVWHEQAGTVPGTGIGAGGCR
ncbi:MAG: hypothetical protein ACRDTH_07785, partial [Pseudonocardiaceae bacterium]